MNVASPTVSVQALMKSKMDAMERTTPVQLMGDNFSLKKTRAAKIERLTMAMLLMPNRMELAKIFEFKALMRKNMDPKLQVPSIIPATKTFLLKNCLTGTRLNRQMRIPDVKAKKKDAPVNPAVSPFERYSCCTNFTRASKSPMPIKRIMGRWI